MFRPAMSSLVALGLGACAPSEPPSGWPQAPAVQGQRGLALTTPTLTLTVDSIVPAGTTTFTLTGAGPNEQVQLTRSTAGTGAGPCLGTLGLLCLDILQPRIHTTLQTDASGTATLVQTIPEQVPIGADVWFQAVIARGSTGSLWVKSAAEHRTIEDAPLTVPAMSAGDLVISELMLDPDAVPDGRGQWFEIRNASGLDANLDGLSISDGVATETVGQTTMLAAGERLVFGREADPTLNGGVEVDRTVGLLLPDWFGELVLLDGTVVIDAVGWDNGASFPLQPGSSLVLAEDLDHVDNDLGVSWCLPKVTFGLGDYGSPGEANSCDPPTLHLADAEATLIGQSAYDTLGWQVSGAGDVDGDGFDDVLVGAYGYDEGTDYSVGAAYLFRGPVTGDLDPASADAILTGESASDYAGYSVAGAGDVDGDGFADLLIGAPYVDVGSESNVGAAYLVLGPVSGPVDLATADARIVGADGGDLAGYRVAGAGDVDGDGFDDLLIGALGVDHHGTNAGAAYLVLGPVSGEVDLATEADARMFGMVALDEAGTTLAGAGDVNGDGFGDLVIGAPNADTAYLVLGPVTGDMDLDDADARLLSEDVGDRLGDSVAGAGDVNGDGFDDLLVGASDSDSSAGAAYVIEGPVSGDISMVDATAILRGDPSTSAGFSVAGPGDLDGDGHDDLLIGAPTNGGAAYVVLGPVSGERSLSYADLMLVDDESALTGRSVAGAGDVDGDGRPDLLVADPYWDVGAEYNFGATWLVLGSQLPQP